MRNEARLLKDALIGQKRPQRSASVQMCQDSVLVEVMQDCEDAGVREVILAEFERRELIASLTTKEHAEFVIHGIEFHCAKDKTSLLAEIPFKYLGLLSYYFMQEDQQKDIRDEIVKRGN